MQQLQFSIDISASAEKIWRVLWEDETFRDWANFIDPGTYLVGDLKEGKEVQWISGSSGLGVTSLVEKLIANEIAVFRHKAGTQDLGARDKDSEWTGGTETYALKEHGGFTSLTVELDTPPEHVEGFTVILPKVLQRIKELSESGR